MSYIPGTEANRESRAAAGQEPNYYSSGNKSSSTHGYLISNTARSTGGGVASYIPGTEANRISRAEHGQNPNTFSSGNTGSNTGAFLLTLDACKQLLFMLQVLALVDMSSSNLYLLKPALD